MDLVVDKSSFDVLQYASRKHLLKVWILFPNTSFQSMGRSGTSVGKMGRDGGVKAAPVDLYRRQIARQDSKKEKKHIKEYKLHQEAKEKTPKAFKDMVTSQSPLSILLSISATFNEQLFNPHSFNKKL